MSTIQEPHMIIIQGQKLYIEDRRYLRGRQENTFMFEKDKI